MADGERLLANDSDITESALGRAAYDPNSLGYKAEGLGVTPNFSANEITVAPGLARIGYQGERVPVELYQTVTRGFASSGGDNYVTLEFDPVDVGVYDSEGSIPDTALLLAVVDADAETSESRNDNPDVGIGRLTSDVDANGHDINNAGAVTTEQASIGTVSGQGDVFRLIGREEPETDTTTVEFTGLSSGSFYILSYDFREESSDEECQLTFNNDDADNNENYSYYDATAVLQENQDEIELIDMRSVRAQTGHVYIGSESQIGARVGVDHKYMGPSVEGFNDFARNGFYEGGEISSIQFTVTGAIQGGSGIIELWEREYE